MNEIPASNFDPKTAYRAESFRVFPHLLEANSRMVYRIVPQRLTFVVLMIPSYRSICHFKPFYMRFDNDGSKS
jgi:hypothetical protein